MPKKKKGRTHHQPARTLPRQLVTGLADVELLLQHKRYDEARAALAELHEEVQSLMNQGQWPQARRRAEKILQRQPDFIPVLNNLSQLYFADGQVDQAIATAQRVLALDPANYHALSNLARYLCLSG